MTNLKEINFGLNQYCGPAVLSALTGESTDRCAAVISAVSGRKEIKAVSKEHIKEALKRLRFNVEEQSGGSTLWGVLYRLHEQDGMYVVFVPNHVVAVEVKDNQIYICDNHTKTPLDIKQSARLTQKVHSVFKVVSIGSPVFVKSIVLIKININSIEVISHNCYENTDDDTEYQLGYLRFKNEKELEEILYKLHSLYEGEF